MSATVSEGVSGRLAAKTGATAACCNAINGIAGEEVDLQKSCKAQKLTCTQAATTHTIHITLVDFKICVPLFGTDINSTDVEREAEERLTCAASLVHQLPRHEQLLRQLPSKQKLLFGGLGTAAAPGMHLTGPAPRMTMSQFNGTTAEMFHSVAKDATQQCLSSSHCHYVICFHQLQSIMQPLIVQGTKIGSFGAEDKKVPQLSSS